MTGFSCFDCQFGVQSHPCRTDGQIDLPKLAATFVERTCFLSGDGTGGAHWSYSCVGDLVQEDAETGWVFLLEAARHLKDPEQACVFAAGVLEDFIRKHGEAWIDRIEAEAASNLRFRYLLTGVWPQRNGETAYWQRIVVARGISPSIDGGDALPPIT